MIVADVVITGNMGRLSIPFDHTVFLILIALCDFDPFLACVIISTSDVLTRRNSHRIIVDSAISICNRLHT
jgi:hypothetical protein